MADLTEVSWKQIVAWTVFIGVISGMVYAAYTILAKTDFGQIFSNLFGITNSLLHGLNAQVQTCQTEGWFSSGCWLGPVAVSAAILAALVGITKFALGPATETRIGRLWEQIKGKKITVEDMNSIEAKVKEVIAEAEGKNAKYNNLTDEQKELVKESGTIHTANNILQETIKNDSTINAAKKQAMINEANDAKQEKLNEIREKFIEESTDQDEAEADADEALNISDEMFAK